MGEIQLLDCTLRDGGYVNDWEFGNDAIVSIYERLVSAGIDIIEVGFLDDRRTFDPNRSIMPNTDCVGKIYGRLQKQNSMIVGMIDYGTCSIDHLSPSSESYLDGIRVIFKKHIMHEALEFCGKVKALGYKVFTQAVSITTYSDEEFHELIRCVNELKPYAMSMVDTYGLLHQGGLMHYFNLADQWLLPEIGLGYHSHNNFQMGYANCIEVLKKNVKRRLLVDGSVFGMGKSAGNAPIELLIMYMNANLGKNYDINQILEAIDVNIMPIYREKYWGYNFQYYLSASNDCHPNYVSFLRDKHTLSVKSINEILGRLQGEKKLLYDKAHIEKLYLEYQTKDIDDTDAYRRLEEELSGKRLLVIGPGKSIRAEQDKIQKYIREYSPTVVTLNFIIKDYYTNYVFISNSKRYLQMTERLSHVEDSVRVIATSNVTRTKNEFDYKLRYSTLLDHEAKIVDNSFIMFLKILKRINVNQVMLAGFDGYSLKDGSNYFRSSMDYKFDKEQAKEINRYVSEKLKEFSQQMNIKFLTESNYESV